MDSPHRELLAIIFMLCGAMASTAAPVNVSVYPLTQTLVKGQELTLNISIDPVNNPIAAAQFNLLFNSSFIQVKNVSEGTLFKQKGANTIFNSGTLNNSSGTLINVWGLIITPGANVTTKGTLAKITMYAKETGTSPLNLTNLIISDPKSNVIQTTITNGFVRVSPDITPPASITNFKNTSYARNYINWTWNDPYDSDFSKVMIYLNGTFKANVSKGSRYYNATILSANTTYTLSAHTVDTSGNINLTWVNNTARTAPAANFIFFDDFESGANNWSFSGLWHGTTKRSNSSNHSFWYGQESTGNYDTGSANSGGLISPAIRIENNSKPMLSFMSWYQTDYFFYYDKKLVQISVNNGTWTGLKQTSDARNIWNREQVDLSGYAGKTIKIKFYFDTVNGFYNNYEGWYIDDVKIV